jgi:anti-anti-sigma regulatory factor
VRLNLQYTTAPPHAGQLAVSGIVDWTTIDSFRAGLSRFRQSLHPDGLVDLTGLLSWSPQAQTALAGAIWAAQLHGGHLTVVGLQPIPAWQARHSGLPGTDPLTRDAPTAWGAAHCDRRVSTPGR